MLRHRQVPLSRTASRRSTADTALVIYRQECTGRRRLDMPALPISRLSAICSVSEPSTSRSRLPALYNAPEHSADVLRRLSGCAHRPSHFTGNVVSFITSSEALPAVDENLNC